MCHFLHCAIKTVRSNLADSQNYGGHSPSFPMLKATDACKSENFGASLANDTHASVIAVTLHISLG